MKTQIGMRGWSIALMLVAAALPARATSFSAELVDTRGGETRTAPFACQDQNYRFEMGAGAQTLIVTGDNKTGAVRLLVPAEKLYVESGPDEPRSWMTSPFAFFAHYARANEVRSEGTEAIDGIACTKRVAFSGEQVFATAWFSAEYGFPLKVEVPILSRTIELRHVKAGPQEASLFAVPAGYQPAPKEEEPPPPAWAAQISSAPVLTPPFEKTLAEGKILRMKPQAGRQIRVQGTNKTQATCGFTGIGFKNGRPLGDPSMSTVNIEPGQEVTLTFEERPAETDDLVIHVRNGTATLKAEFVGGSVGMRGQPAAAEPVSAEAPPAAEPSAELHAPVAADMASRIEVGWTGPAEKDDYVALARPDHPAGRHVSLTRVREGNPLKVWAPSEPGEFEIRYVLARGAKVLARSPITINAVTATVSATGPVKAASWIEVKWTGPAAEGDFVGVARPNLPAILERTLVKQGNPLRVRAPGEPGEYEVRYILGRGVKVLAKVPLTVEAVTATVTAPTEAKAGMDFEVRWTGPGYPEDLIVIAKPDQAAGANVGSKTIRAGSPLKIRAPKAAGTYEIRYLLGRGKRPLAKAVVTVNP